jgi:uncharacterized RDD family membrane protein YckC/predicted RNA-binding Zn-ribbon protein involved in translation (DUF1610 family)
MSHRLVCSCGKDVALEAGEPTAICPACGSRVKEPGGTHRDGRPQAAVDPAHVEQVSTEKGICWKLVCICNKRILVPQKAEAAAGRCPKCGRLLRLPSPDRLRESPAQEPEAPDRARPDAPVLAPSAPDDALSDLVIDLPAPPGSQPYATPDVLLPIRGETRSPVKPEPAATEPKPISAARIEEPASRGAALRTADILRSKKLSERSPGPGLISAWPLAGRLPRALAGFIDLTLGLVAATLIVVGGSLELLPEVSRYLLVPVVAFLTAVLLNDGLFQAVGGSIGKRFVVLTLRTPEGLTPSVTVIVLRAFLKWLLFPGWILALVHPSQRALHDMICDTYVMKGRVRH